jgi:hypothetical protein
MNRQSKLHFIIYIFWRKYNKTMVFKLSFSNPEYALELRY